MSARSPRPRPQILGSALLLLAAVVALQFGFAEPSLLYLAPALLLLLPLAFDRYPGESLLRAVRDRPRRPRAGVASRPRYLVPLAPLPRGGALLASALAGRAPPWLAAAPARAAMRTATNR